MKDRQPIQHNPLEINVAPLLLMQKNNIIFPVHVHVFNVLPPPFTVATSNSII